MRNRRGPSAEPCGTPDSIVEKSADDPLRTTRCFLGILHALPAEFGVIKGLMNFDNKVYQLVCSGITGSKTRLIFSNNVVVVK